MTQSTDVKKKFAMRWQLPLLIVALAFLTKSAFLLRPAPKELSLERAIPFLESQVVAGIYDAAIDFGNHLLAREDVALEDRGAIHFQLARAWFGLGSTDRYPTVSMGETVVHHYDTAKRYGFPPQVHDREAMGRAFEWQQRYARALQQYAQALEQGVDHPFDLRHRMLHLEINKLRVSPKILNEKLSLFIADLGEQRLDLRYWAINRNLEVFDDLNEMDQAATMLARNRELFYNSDLRDHFAYMEAWLLYKTNHYNEAETRLRTIRNRLEEENEVHAMTGWLLGQVVLRDGGPQRPMEALSFYHDVMQKHGDSPFAVASRIGAGEALGLLERHEEALDAFRLAIEDLRQVEDTRLVNRAALRTTLGVMGEMHRRMGRLVVAVEYTQLAVELIDPDNAEQASIFLQQLGNSQLQLAEFLEAQEPVPHTLVDEHSLESYSPIARKMYVEAAVTFLKLAQMNILNDERGAASSWRAAELFTRGGENERATQLYASFVRERPNHSFVPRGLLRMGQIYHRSGDLVAAVETYKECYRRFPRSLDGARALVPLARCYMALGPKYEELAEKTLLIVLGESEVFTPQAPEFTDALYLYGDGLNRAHEYNRSIAALEEALERYPKDARALRAEYLLADSYRKSGLALKAGVENVQSPGEIQQIHREAVARFKAARDLYRDLIEKFDFRSPAQFTPLQRMYRRHTYLYEADCYFETQEYRQALKLYEEAVGLFKDSPIALSAYVQIINSHVFLGEPEEARASLARAQVLVDSIHSSAFADSVSPEKRDDWKRYLNWVEDSKLF